MVTGATAHGGLGFGYKWDMGWMHDTLQYVRRDPVHRRFHHDEVTFRSVYAFTERYVMPLSHDEVVHGKGSLIGKMPGRRLAALRQPAAAVRDDVGPAGQEAAVHGRRARAWSEWNHDAMVDWGLHDAPMHSGVRLWVAALNQLYRDEPALAAGTPTRPGSAGSSATTTPTACSPGCASTRPTPRRPCWRSINATPTVHYGYRIGVPTGGRWVELLNSDAEVYGGSGMGNLGGVDAEDHPWHGFERSLPLTLPAAGRRAPPPGRLPSTVRRRRDPSADIASDRRRTSAARGRDRGAMSYEDITFEVADDGVATLTINRPR
jgi:1,4-alpha-glucan branching enzyme